VWRRRGGNLAGTSDDEGAIVELIVGAELHDGSLDLRNHWAGGRERFADEISEPGLAVRRRLELHLDGVVNMSSDVPTGCVAGMREERSSARDVFFGLDRV
jgi:hypothetical protein